MNDELKKEMYRKMRLIRGFEENVERLINIGEIGTISHLYIGEEAVAVGVCSALRADDCITSTHRGHGHILAKGGDPRRMMAELYGRTTGYNKGKGGTMHIAHLALGILGANGIVGAGVPIAAGAAWASKYNGSDEVAAAFFGDGGINTGVVLETMNLAAIWELPIIFVCENNQYAIGTPIKQMCPIELYQRAQGFGIPGVQVDGMNVEAVFEVASEAVERARSGRGSTFIECKAFRYRGHFTGEERFPNPYRSKDELEFWLAKDPVKWWGQKLVDEGIWQGDERSQVDAEIDDLIKEAIEYARSSPMPKPEDALEDMYVNEYEGLPAKGWI